MKKSISIFMILCMLGLASCGAEEKTSADTDVENVVDSETNTEAGSNVEENGTVGTGDTQEVAEEDYWEVTMGDPDADFLLVVKVPNKYIVEQFNNSAYYSSFYVNEGRFEDTREVLGVTILGKADDIGPAESNYTYWINHCNETEGYELVDAREEEGMYRLQYTAVDTYEEAMKHVVYYTEIEGYVVYGSIATATNYDENAEITFEDLEMVLNSMVLEVREKSAEDSAETESTEAAGAAVVVE